jgi:hypothetical protein
VQSVRIDAAHAARHDHGPGSRAHDEGVELLPACLGELLRVVEARQRLPVGERQALEVEQDRRREQRSGEAAATGLVRTRDEAVAELAVEGEQPAAAAPGRAGALGGARYPAARAPARGFRSSLEASRWRRPCR